MKKILNRLLTRHFFSAIVVFILFFNLINKYRDISLNIGGFILAFAFFNLIESSYQQYIEDKASGEIKQSPKQFFRMMKNQTFKQFIHNVDWLYVFGVAFLLAVLYLVFLVVIPLWITR